jgi:hypothetical protein
LAFILLFYFGIILKPGRGTLLPLLSQKTRKSLCAFARDILVAAIRIRGILRLSSAACRQVPENSRTFPPLKKGGQGGFSMLLSWRKNCSNSTTLVTRNFSHSEKLSSRIQAPLLPCHPEESASRVIPRSVSDEGSAVENTDGRRAKTGKNPPRDHRKTLTGHWKGTTGG